MATIEASAIKSLKAEVDKVTSNPDGAGGIVYCAVNKNGDLIFEHASGKLGKGRPEPMTSDSVFWIASCTKMIVGIACMQLVEQGKLALDDVELVERIAPVSEELTTVSRWGLMNAVGAESCEGSGRGKVGAKEARNYLENAAFAYWSAFR